jgi:hypothetical protein
MIDDAINEVTHIQGGHAPESNEGGSEPWVF